MFYIINTTYYAYCSLTATSAKCPHGTLTPNTRPVGPPVKQYLHNIPKRHKTVNIHRQYELNLGT